MTTQERRWLGSATPADGALIPTTTVARIVLVLVIGAGIYFFHDFLVPVLAALVIGFASWPLYRRVLARFDGNRPLAATFAILLVLAFIVVPVVMAVSYMIGEVDVWYDWVVTTNRLGSPTPEWLLVLPGVGPWLDEQWVRHIGHPGAISELVQLLSGENIASISRTVLAAGRGLFDLLLAMLFMLIALFFIYKDGENFMVQVDRLGEQIFPLRWQRISRVVPATISSTVMGMTVIAIGEGIVLGIAYWVAGVPSPVTLGVITGLMALIPGGAPLCFSLVSVYLVASGSPIAGIALFAWGSTELFIVDKTLRPKLVGGPVKLPFLPTFFGLIGGVKTMGFVGLFVGPVLMALLVALWREWVREADAPEPPPPLP